MSQESDAEAVRISQRHDFIKEYYKMATMDLDRHLKQGWQAIVILAGGAAIIAAGHDGKIWMPIASTAAIGLSTWGAMSVIDANYWSVRAIGFLANVEAVYFSEEDRRRFNPYIGKHPPYNLLNSLRYMFWLCVVFALGVILHFVWEVSTGGEGQKEVSFSDMGVLSRLGWLLPLIAVPWAIAVTRHAWDRCRENYLEFSVTSPGPGIVSTDAQAVGVASLSVGDRRQAVQDELHGSLRRQTAAAIWIRRLLYLVAIVGTLVGVWLAVWPQPIPLWI